MRWILLCAVSVCLLMTSCFANDGYLPDGKPDWGSLRWTQEVPAGYVAIPHGGFVKQEDLFPDVPAVRKVSTSTVSRTETIRQVAVTRRRDLDPRPPRQRHQRAALRQAKATQACDCGCGRRHCHCNRRSS